MFKIDIKFLTKKMLVQNVQKSCSHPPEKNVSQFYDMKAQKHMTVLIYNKILISIIFTSTFAEQM